MGCVHYAVVVSEYKKLIATSRFFLGLKFLHEWSAHER